MSENGWAGVYLAVTILCALYLLRDICVMKSSSFKEVGRRKSVWLLVWLISTPIFLSPFVLVWYLIRVRPAVRQADMDHIAARHRKKMARRQKAYSRQHSTPSRTSSSSSADSFQRTPQRCSGCGGSGKLPCGPCQGRGYRTSSTPSANTPYFNQESCMNCGRSGKVTCGRCGGRGTV